MKKIFIIGIFTWFSVCFASAQNNAKPIISSRDFSQTSELWESIGRGIINYQADVMYIYGKLYVTPVMPDSANHKLPTLTEAYLYPLYNQYKKNNGEILPGYVGDIYLILNFTFQPIQIYRQLAAEMRPFAEMLTYTSEGKKHQGKLTILIKEKNQLEQINSIKPSFLSLVGNLSDVDKNIDSAKMPLIEVSFDELTSWKGIGNIAFEDFTKIRNLVDKVHAQNKKISFVNCPASKNMADLIKTAKLDFVNTPDDVRMADFLQK